MNNFDINSYIDGIEMEEWLSDEYLSLDECFDDWEDA